MYRKLIRCVIALVVLLAANGEAVQIVPASPNTMKVILLMPVNEGMSSFTGAQMFEFATDTGISFGSGWSCLVANPISWFAVPKANPSPGGTGENPSYRDHVNTLMLAYALNKPINLYVDGCIGGVPRVVGMYLQP